LAQGFNGNPPLSVVFLIQHIDPTGAKSAGVSIVAMPPQTVQYDGIPHLPNQFYIPLVGVGSSQINPAFGQAYVVYQDSVDEIEACVNLLLGTTRGQRGIVPTYGLDDPTFDFTTPQEIETLVGLWEPRADVSVSVVPDDAGNEYINVTLLNT
jgi:phage baseplate assembly protein W